MLYTISDIDTYLKQHLSEKRYEHCKGVASTMKMLFEKYGYKSSTQTHLALPVAEAVGLLHDIAREYSSENLIAISGRTDVEPVLLHGEVGVKVANSLLPSPMPKDWEAAITWHTVGNINMSYTGLCLFIADFIEPNRTFLTDEDRKHYLQQPSMNLLAFEILKSMNNHRYSKGLEPSQESKDLLKFFQDGNKIE